MNIIIIDIKFLIHIYIYIILKKVQNPKKVLNPYNKFVKEEFPKIKAENPNITPNDAFKEAAVRVNIYIYIYFHIINFN